jgi:acetyltransferase-like isoleucine patch superfamily enzyme
MANITKFGHAPKKIDVTYYLDGFPLVHVGEFSYIGELCVLTYNSPPPISHIGRYCSIAEDVKFLLVADHPHDLLTTYPMFHKLTALPNKMELMKNSGTKTKMDNLDIEINVGSDVWIGHGASILSGVKIGHGAVIGAFSVVAKDIPPYAIAVGNPAKIIK